MTNLVVHATTFLRGRLIIFLGRNGAPDDARVKTEIYSQAHHLSVFSNDQTYTHRIISRSKPIRDRARAALLPIGCGPEHGSKFVCSLPAK